MRPNAPKNILTQSKLVHSFPIVTLSKWIGSLWHVTRRHVAIDLPFQQFKFNISISDNTEYHGEWFLIGGMDENATVHSDILYFDRITENFYFSIRKLEVGRCSFGVTLIEYQ